MSRTVGEIVDAHFDDVDGDYAKPAAELLDRCLLGRGAALRDLPDAATEWTPADWLGVALFALDQGGAPMAVQRAALAAVRRHFEKYDDPDLTADEPGSATESNRRFDELGRRERG